MFFDFSNLAIQIFDSMLQLTFSIQCTKSHFRLSAECVSLFFRFSAELNIFTGIFLVFSTECWFFSIGCFSIQRHRPTRRDRTLAAELCKKKLNSFCWWQKGGKFKFYFISFIRQGYQKNDIFGGPIWEKIKIKLHLSFVSVLWFLFKVKNSKLIFWIRCDRLMT